MKIIPSFFAGSIRFGYVFRFCVAGLCGMFVAGVVVQDAVASANAAMKVVESYPVGSVISVDTADAALAEAGAARARIEARYSAEEQACHPRFFTTACIDGAKERRRRALSQLRPIEIEANTFKRQARVAGREQALTKKQGQETVGQSQQATLLEDANVVSVRSTDDQETAKVPEATRNVQTTIFSDRSTLHEARLKRVQAEKGTDVEKRAGNIVAYEKKVLVAEARQREVQARKAEKEQKRLMRELSQPNLR